MTAFITVAAISVKLEADRSLEAVKEDLKRLGVYTELYFTISSDVESLYSCISRLQSGEWSLDEYRAVDKKIEETCSQADELRVAGLFDPSYLHRFHNRAYFISGGAEELNDEESRRVLWRKEAVLFADKYSELKEELQRCQTKLTSSGH